MKFYNVYSDSTWRVFASPEEANLPDNVAFFDDKQVFGQRIYRYGRYDEETFFRLSKEREEILANFNQYNKMWNENNRSNTVSSLMTALWTEYSRFWFEHRNVTRGH